MWWDSESDSSDNNDNEAESEAISSIKRCSGLTELHYQGVALDGLIEGPHVEDRVKWNVMWAADWDMDREVDLKVVLKDED
jgi:hypothetical protein